MLNAKPLTRLSSSIGGGFSFLLHRIGSGGHDGDALAVAITAFAGVALVAAIWYSSRSDKSPFSYKRRKYAISPHEWESFFDSEGKLVDGGVTFLKKVRNGGVDLSIRAEVWPFLLGVYDLKSCKDERDFVKSKKRKEYEKLRRQCRRLLKQIDRNHRLKEQNNQNPGILVTESDFSGSEDDTSARESLSSEKEYPISEYSDDPSSTLLDHSSSSRRVGSMIPSAVNSDSSDSGSEEMGEVIQAPSSLPSERDSEEGDGNSTLEETKSTETNNHNKKDTNVCAENFENWQRIIRLDAVRANAEWIPYSQSQASVSRDRACRSAETVGLKDYGHLEPCRIFHAARLVAILEAYAVYDIEIGYCQGMSDLLSPIITVIEEDYMAFWCFVGFMQKARHNFRLDEVGIRRQLSIVSKIIKSKDSHLYRHLVMLQAEDCFFVYRMVVVLFRRELTFEQTLSLWEVMWADQVALRAGIGKTAWSRIRHRAPPTEDLLLYAIAASVLQRRKLIIEKYDGMDEILRECNNMSGKLDVWKLLDDAHDLVISLHDKI